MHYIVQKAILLAAGRGTRLGRLTAHQPKPLLEIDGKPILAHIVDGLTQAGIKHIIVVSGYLSDQVESLCASLEDASQRIQIARQSELNGTGGALVAAMPLLEREPEWYDGEIVTVFERQKPGER